MPTGPTIGARGLARLTAAAFFATAAALGATAAYASFVGAGGMVPGVLLAMAGVCAVFAAWMLRAGRKVEAAPSAGPLVRRPAAPEPKQLEIFPLSASDDRPDQRY